MLTLTGLAGFGEVAEGDELAELASEAVARAGTELADGDVVVICQKAVSKAEGQVAQLDELQPARIARAWALANDRDAREVQAVLAEARRVVRTAGPVLITETRHGFVCANSGVDRSNVPPGSVCLLPEDPDRSAVRLAERLSAAAGAQVGVVISDTWGRPFRLGAVNVAIGVSGFPPLLDYGGQRDPSGRTLGSSRIAIADEIAAAAGMLMGKLRRIPAVLVRGIVFETDAPPGNGATLLRSAGEDLFR